MTMNVYGRVREEHLSQAVEKVADNLFSDEKCVPSVYRKVAGLQQESATPITNKELRSLKLVEAAGIEPAI